MKIKAAMLFIFLDSPPMHLNLFQNHFSYIKNFSTFAVRYKCQLCDRIFNRSDNLQRHVMTCSNDVKEVYVGGKYKPKETIFQLLEKEGYVVPKEDRYYKFVSVFDYESVQIKNEETSKGRFIKYTHQPITFSICSNIPGHTKAKHRVSNDPQKLVDKMVTIQLRQQKCAEAIIYDKFRHIIDSLQA